MCKRTPMPKPDFNKVAKFHHNSFLLRYLILRNISCIYDQKAHGKTTYEWHADEVRVHTSDIRLTYEYIRVPYRWHTSTIEWHTHDIRVQLSDIRMTYEYIRVTYGWHTSKCEWHTDDIRVHTSEWHPNGIWMTWEIVSRIKDLELLDRNFQIYFW